ncbi:MAG: TPM domain-containing protein [Lachnospiraceae bacterium]|nr:TPM domain-containing protein [Lachnospiraceae bacterium]
MKKIWIRILVMLFLLTLLPACINVEEVNAAAQQRLVDDGELLERDVRKELERKLDKLARRYKLDVGILTVQDYEMYDSTLPNYSTEAFASSYYYDRQFGFDEEDSGILLVISMEERDWHIYIVGEARVAVNDYGFEYISERLVDKLSDDKYEEGIVRYVDDLEKFFQAYDKGEAYGSDNKVKETKRILLYFGIAMILSLAIAIGIVQSMKIRMNTAKPQPAAREYVKQGSFVLTENQDLYLYSHTTRTARPKNESSSGGSSGGGSSSGSRGGSGGGGKF